MPTKRQLETDFAADLKRELEDRFPDCFIYKMDPNQVQGIPDLLLLHEENWALLETKRWTDSVKQPNQDYYVEQMNERSFSAFINPQNREEVMNDLQIAFGVERPARVS